ncbi:hypothetical protein ACHAWF_001332 [Thalassiosira exigua]
MAMRSRGGHLHRSAPAPSVRVVYCILPTWASLATCLSLARARRATRTRPRLLSFSFAPPHTAELDFRLVLKNKHRPCDASASANDTILRARPLHSNIMTPLRLLFLIVACGLAIAPPCHAFASQNDSFGRPHGNGIAGSARPSHLFSSPTKEPPCKQLPQSSLDQLDVIKLALKRPRGYSVGVEYAPEEDVSGGDLSILSMQLRKSKCAAIWTSDLSSVAQIAREQEGSRGDFPGPVPVIYSGPVSDGAAEAYSDATAVVLEYGHVVEPELLNDVGVIWKVDTMEQLLDLIDAEDNSGGVFLLSENIIPCTVDEDSSELKDTLTNLPKSIVTVAPLSSMLPENNEINLGKHFASLGVSSLLLKNACVGDEEDAKYCQFFIEEVSKKSSSSFSMTGLTGSTNGHFGVSSHGGEVKWRRNS